MNTFPAASADRELIQTNQNEIGADKFEQAGRARHSVRAVVRKTRAAGRGLPALPSARNFPIAGAAGF
jgi:hypothetical protein